MDAEKKRVPVKVKFPKALMLDILHDGVGEIVSDEISHKTRWSLVHELIFAFEGKRYRAYYNVGATEQQDEGPWEHVTEVECTEMESYEATVLKHRPVMVDV